MRAPGSGGCTAPCCGEAAARFQCFVGLRLPPVGFGHRLGSSGLGSGEQNLMELFVLVPGTCLSSGSRYLCAAAAQTVNVGCHMNGPRFVAAF